MEYFIKFLIFKKEKEDMFKFGECVSKITTKKTTYDFSEVEHLLVSSILKEQTKELNNTVFVETLGNQSFFYLLNYENGDEFE